MLKVRLFCAGSMSTTLLVQKVAAAAKQEGEEIDIEAHGISSIARWIDESLDCVLIGPQIASRKDEVKAVCDEHGVPMGIISVTDYGMVNGRHVYELAKQVAARKGMPDAPILEVHEGEEKKHKKEKGKDREKKHKKDHSIL